MFAPVLVFLVYSSSLGQQCFESKLSRTLTVWTRHKDSMHVDHLFSYTNPWLPRQILTEKFRNPQEVQLCYFSGAQSVRKLWSEPEYWWSIAGVGSWSDATVQNSQSYEQKQDRNFVVLHMPRLIAWTAQNVHTGSLHGNALYQEVFTPDHFLQMLCSKECSYQITSWKCFVAKSVHTRSLHEQALYRIFSTGWLPITQMPWRIARKRHMVHTASSANTGRLIVSQELRRTAQ